MKFKYILISSIFILSACHDKQTEIQAERPHIQQVEIVDTPEDIAKRKAEISKSRKRDCELLGKYRSDVPVCKDIK